MFSIIKPLLELLGIPIKNKEIDLESLKKEKIDNIDYIQEISDFCRNLEFESNENDDKNKDEYNSAQNIEDLIVDKILKNKPNYFYNALRQSKNDEKTIFNLNLDVNTDENNTFTLTFERKDSIYNMTLTKGNKTKEIEFSSDKFHNTFLVNHADKFKENFINLVKVIYKNLYTINDSQKFYDSIYKQIEKNVKDKLDRVKNKIDIEKDKIHNENKEKFKDDMNYIQNTLLPRFTTNQIAYLTFKGDKNVPQYISINSSDHRHYKDQLQLLIKHNFLAIYILKQEYTIDFTNGQLKFIKEDEGNFNYFIFDIINCIYQNLYFFNEAQQEKDLNNDNKVNAEDSKSSQEEIDINQTNKIVIDNVNDLQSSIRNYIKNENFEFNDRDNFNKNEYKKNKEKVIKNILEKEKTIINEISFSFENEIKNKIIILNAINYNGEKNNSNALSLCVNRNEEKNIYQIEFTKSNKEITFNINKEIFSKIFSPLYEGEESPLFYLIQTIYEILYNNESNKEISGNSNENISVQEVKKEINDIVNDEDVKKEEKKEEIQKIADDYIDSNKKNLDLEDKDSFEEFTNSILTHIDEQEIIQSINEQQRFILFINDHNIIKSTALYNEYKKENKDTKINEILVNIINQLKTLKNDNTAKLPDILIINENKISLRVRNNYLLIKFNKIDFEFENCYIAGILSFLNDSKENNIKKAFKDFISKLYDQIFDITFEDQIEAEKAEELAQIEAENKRKAEELAQIEAENKRKAEEKRKFEEEERIKNDLSAKEKNNEGLYEQIRNVYSKKDETDNRILTARRITENFNSYLKGNETFESLIPFEKYSKREGNKNQIKYCKITSKNSEFQKHDILLLLSVIDNKHQKQYNFILFNKDYENLLDYIGKIFNLDEKFIKEIKSKKKKLEISKIEKIPFFESGITDFQNQTISSFISLLEKSSLTKGKINYNNINQEGLDLRYSDPEYDSSLKNNDEKTTEEIEEEEKKKEKKLIFKKLNENLLTKKEELLNTDDYFGFNIKDKLEIKEENNLNNFLQKTLNKWEHRGIEQNALFQKIYESLNNTTQNLELNINEKRKENLKINKKDNGIVFEINNKKFELDISDFVLQELKNSNGISSLEDNLKVTYEILSAISVILISNIFFSFYNKKISIEGDINQNESMKESCRHFKKIFDNYYNNIYSLNDIHNIENDNIKISIIQESLIVLFVKIKEDTYNILALPQKLFKIKEENKHNLLNSLFNITSNGSKINIKSNREYFVKEANFFSLGDIYITTDELTNFSIDDLTKKLNAESIQQSPKTIKGNIELYYDDYLNESSFILRIRGKSLILENIGKRLLVESDERKDFEKLNINYFKTKYEQIEKLENSLKKAEKDKKEDLKKSIKKAEYDLRMRIIMQMIRNVDNLFKNMKDPESNISKKITSHAKDQLGFEPTPLNFAMNSALKFETMTKFSRSISSFILNLAISQLQQLNLIYFMFENDNLNQNDLKNMYIQYESNLKNIQESMKNEKVSKNFEEMIKSIEQNFGAESETYDKIKKTYQDILQGIEQINGKQNEFKNMLSDFWTNYSSLKSDSEKITFRIQMLKKFLELKDSKEIDYIYKIYLSNVSFFVKTLTKIKNESNNLGLGVLLEENSKKTFDRIYAEEKEIFDKTFNKINVVLGKGKDQGKLSEMFNSIEGKINELQKNLETVGDKNKSNEQDEENKMKQETKPESENNKNKNTNKNKPVKSDVKQDKSEDKKV